MLQKVAFSSIFLVGMTGFAAVCLAQSKDPNLTKPDRSRTEGQIVVPKDPTPKIPYQFKEKPTSTPTPTPTPSPTKPNQSKP